VCDKTCIDAYIIYTKYISLLHIILFIIVLIAKTINGYCLFFRFRAYTYYIVCIKWFDVNLLPGLPRVKKKSRIKNIPRFLPDDDDVWRASRSLYARCIKHYFVFYCYSVLVLPLYEYTVLVYIATVYTYHYLYIQQYNIYNIMIHLISIQFVNLFGFEKMYS